MKEKKIRAGNRRFFGGIAALIFTSTLIALFVFLSAAGTQQFLLCGKDALIVCGSFDRCFVAFDISLVVVFWCECILSIEAWPMPIDCVSLRKVGIHIQRLFRCRLCKVIGCFERQA